MNWCRARHVSSELVSAFGIVAYPSHYIKPNLLCFLIVLCGNVLAVCWIGSKLGALVHPLVGCAINFIIRSFPFMWGPCVCFFQISPKVGDLEKVNLLSLKAASPEDRFLQVFFKELMAVEHLKSWDVLSLMCVLYFSCSVYCCYLLFFFFLLLFIFFFNVEGRKLQVVTDTGAS